MRCGVTGCTGPTGEGGGGGVGAIVGTDPMMPPITPPMLEMGALPGACTGTGIAPAGTFVYPAGIAKTESGTGTVENPLDSMVIIVMAKGSPPMACASARD